MSRINIRRHKKQFPYIINSFSTAINNLKSYPLLMSGFVAQQARMHVKLDEIILDVCMFSSVSYEQVMCYVKKESTQTGHMVINIAYGLREKALSGMDISGMILNEDWI